MRCTGKTVVRGGMAALMLVATGWVLSGCSIREGQVLPAHLENRVAKDGTSDDHLAAALLYQQEAHRAKTEADKYTQAAASDQAHRRPEGVPAGCTHDGGTDTPAIRGRNAAALCRTSDKGRNDDGQTAAAIRAIRAGPR